MTNRYDARKQAYANVRLSGFKVTDQVKAVYERFRLGEISQLEAFELLGISTGQMTEKTRESLSHTYM